jgi:hypothetical protein
MRFIHLLSVVQEIVRQVIADVPEDATAKRCYSRVPVVIDDTVCEFPERCGEDEEHGGWHDEAVSVHGKIVVNAVEEEVKRDSDTIVRHDAAVMLAFSS